LLTWFCLSKYANVWLDVPMRLSRKLYDGLSWASDTWSCHCQVCNVWLDVLMLKLSHWKLYDSLEAGF
ncbi:hypothetical protein J6590_105997, partial [Homalodisca vitripennis]